MEVDSVVRNQEVQDEDLYIKMKNLEKELEILSIQEDYIKDEQRHLKSEYIRAKEEVSNKLLCINFLLFQIKRIQAVYIGTGNFVEMIDENYAIIGSSSGSQTYVRVLSTLNREDLTPNARVAIHKSSSAIVDILPADTDAAV